MKTSGSKRIAERYVKALFEIAQATRATDAVEADLASLGKALNESADFRHFLNNPLLTMETRAAVMLDILTKIKASDLTRQFIGTLLQQKRLPLLPAILEEFAHVASAARGELSAELITAAPLKDKEIQAVTERLSKAYGQKLRLSVKEDPSLLGGVVLRIGSQQLDSSLAGKLRRLKNTLKAA